MLPRSARLRKRHEFERVYQQGKRITMKAFSLYAYPRHDDAPTRFGFVVGRRFGTHGMRNRLKRRLRAVVRPLLSALPSGYDCVMVARQALPETPFADLHQQVAQAFQEAFGKEVRC
ncbi:MAG: ribonuclease P protein component [Fimbriimonadales bacterium]